MTTRVAGIVLLVVGVAITVVGLGARIFIDDDDGHHDGRTPTFAATDTIGADALIVEADGDVLTVRVERAGQPITDYDDLHDGSGGVFLASADLDWYDHVQLTEDDQGQVSVEVPGDGAYRVVFQAAPAGGPDLLELGTTVDVGQGDGGAGGAVEYIATDDVWSDGSLTIERQGLDFVLSEPFDGPDTAGSPAFLAMFHEGDLLFTHAHAELVGADRFRFTADLPARGEYLAALEFTQGDAPVTALFRLSI